MTDRNTRMRVAYKILNRARTNGDPTEIALAESLWMNAQMSDAELARAMELCDCPEVDAMELDEAGLERLLEDLQNDGL